ncbi:MAG: transposase [Rhodothermales bacterium]
MYDPDRHHRRSRRRPGFNYTQTAAYFVTLCACDRSCLFGAVKDDIVGLNAYGTAVQDAWHESETVRQEIVLDAFVIMPNHLHGIVLIVPPDAEGDLHDPRGYRLDRKDGAASVRRAHGHAPLQDGNLGTKNDEITSTPVGAHGGAPSLHRAPRSLGSFVAGFKTAATTGINRLRGTPGAPVWQRNYHDRILRDEREWRACRQYIHDNPARWAHDQLNPKHR